MTDILAQQGHAALAYARDDMPVLEAIQLELNNTRPLDGERIAGCLHLTKETGVLVQLFKAAGADVAWTGGDEVSTQDEVVAALKDKGVAVFGHRGMSTSEVNEEIQRTLNHHPGGPTIIIDNGARMIRTAIDEIQQFSNLRFATEKTTEGCAELRELATTRPINLPILLVNDVVTKWEVDNTYGTGQSTLDGILRATGKLLAGKVFCVCGYGHVGRGVAMRASGQGARVIVVCRSSATAVRATLDGFQVMPLDQAIARAEILCTATGFPNIVQASHLALARSGIVLCNTGHSVTEIDVNALSKLAADSSQINDHVVRYTFTDGRHIDLIGRGGLVNLAAATGNPSEVMDVTFANQALSVLEAASPTSDLKSGLHDITEAQDESVALRKLAAMGVLCDSDATRENCYEYKSKN